MVRVAVDGRGHELDVGVCGDDAGFARDVEWLWGVFRGAFWEADNGGDEAEFFVHDGAGHAVEEFRRVCVIVPCVWGAGAEDGVKGALEAALGGEIDGEEDEDEVDAVGGGFVAGEDEDEGVAKDFGVGEGLGGGLGRGFEGVFARYAGAFEHGCH